jgi:hypothetical protein
MTRKTYSPFRIHLAGFFTLFLVIYVLDANAQSQFPSPMVDYARLHERVRLDQISGKQFKIENLLSEPVQVYFPETSLYADSVRLLIHFHGAAFVPMYAVEKSSHHYVLASVNLGSGSSVYEQAFQMERTFASFLESIQDSLAILAGQDLQFSGIYLSSFSAGYGAVRAILSQTDALPLLNGVLLLDGLHTDYVPERKVLAEGGKLNEEKLLPFLNFARLAIAGRKDFVITHSEIFPGTYASTTETADYLIQQTSLHRTPVLKWGVLGMQQLSEAKKGRFMVLGFAGNSAPDHIDHFHALYKFLDSFK